jgi:hypothetical protein
VHHHLIATGLRSDTSLVVDTATCYTTHQAAMLIGYGAHAICPYLGYETSRQWRMSARTQVCLVQEDDNEDHQCTCMQQQVPACCELQGFLLHR